MESAPQGDGSHRLVFRPDLDRNATERGLWTHGEVIDERRRALHDAVRVAVVEALTDKQREAIELYFFEGLTQQQIAHRLGVSQQVVHRRIYGARRGGRRVGGALRKLRIALGVPR
ncbi:MAG: sigma-70 family RNA polymerase sigma factor [Myxococcota bacterium]